MSDIYPDGNTAALRIYEREQDKAYARAEEYEAECFERADEILTDAALMEKHDLDWELWTGDPGTLPYALARCFSNLKQARKGEQIGIDAITTALTGLYSVWQEKIARQLESQE